MSDKQVVLVTGVAGYLGSRVAAQLITLNERFIDLEGDDQGSMISGYHVIGLDTTPPKEPIKGLDFIQADVRNPLFIEEVAHSLIENYLVLDEQTGTYRARADLEHVQVPDTVNRVIMSRMDRLDEQVIWADRNNLLHRIQMFFDAMPPSGWKMHDE